MGAPNAENNPDLITVRLGSLDTTNEMPLCRLPKKFVLKKASLINGAALAADGTNYVTCALKNDAATLGTIDTDSGGGADSLVDLTEADFGATADQELAKDSYLTLDFTAAGTGQLTDASLQLYGWWK